MFGKRGAKIHSANKYKYFYEDLKGIIIWNGYSGDSLFRLKLIEAYVRNQMPKNLKKYNFMYNCKYLSWKSCLR